jgi:hypothetical protein
VWNIAVFWTCRYDGLEKWMQEFDLETLQEISHLEDNSDRWDTNIKIDLKEVGCGGDG